MNQDYLSHLSETDKQRHLDWGWEFTEDGLFSQVRTNMMKDVNYVPYCIPCPGLQRYCKTDVIGTIKCPKCGSTYTYPKEFIDRFKVKHGLK